jgi:hypothetical protein
VPISGSLPNDPRNPNLGINRTIDLGNTVAALPAPERADFTAVIAAALASTGAHAVVRAGDHFLGPRGTAAVASVPLMATRRFTLNTNAARQMPDAYPPCVTLCDSSLENSLTPFWVVEAHVLTYWQFTDARGDLVQAATDASGVDDLELALRVSWDGAWHAEPWLSQSLLRACLDPLARVSVPGLTPNNLTDGSPPEPVVGCAMALASTDSPMTVLLMNHFGVVLAANNTAHRLLPALPLATAHEQALARGWLMRSAAGAQVFQQGGTVR